MNILITGCAGFIGFSFSKYLLKNKKNKVFGIDNLNSFYSTKLKKARIKELKKFKKKFIFEKIDVSNEKNLKKYFKSKKFDVVVHLAAQAGVRYSIENPKAYIDSNFKGFFNIINICKNYKIKNFFYASSSSVYGDSKKTPFKENQVLNPKNMYSLSKKNNEEVAKIFYNFYNFNSIGLRFFTVYGEWGRPDMMMLKYISCSLRNKSFYLHNNGNHQRDFTYIEDVNRILEKFIFKKKISGCDVFNVCSSRPVNILKILNIINAYFKKPKIIKVGFQNADVLNTHGSKIKLIKFLKFKKFTTIEKGVPILCEWAKKNFPKFL